MNFFNSICVLISACLFSMSLIEIPNKKDCLTVSPGGISGYWNSLASLQKLNNTEEYYCASSGCLSIVSKDIPVIDLIILAVKSKKLKSFSKVKNKFILELISKIHYVPNMTIITMNSFGSCIQRKPRDKIELLSLLITTTDVPFISNRASKEMDGGLCLWLLKPCKKEITVPKNYRFIINLFNTQMKLSDVNYFYNY